MKGKVSTLLLVLILTFACTLGSTAPTQTPLLSISARDRARTPTARIPLTPATLVRFTRTPTSTPPPERTFTISVLVDLTSEPVTREQAQVITKEASGILFGLTGFKLAMIDFQEFSTGTPDEMVRNYLASRPPSTIPNGVILFSFGAGGMARLYGGYSYVVSGPGTYANQFVSPYAHENDIYIGVIHFSHHYGICGYGDSETPISEVSIDGECRNQPGTACVEKFGYSMCSNVVDDLYASTPTYMASSSFVHEFMHPFGSNLAQDHYFSPECTATMLSGISARPYQSESFNKAEADFYVNMCPFVFDNFVNSYRP